MTRRPGAESIRARQRQRRPDGVSRQTNRVHRQGKWNRWRQRGWQRLVTSTNRTRRARRAMCALLTAWLAARQRHRADMRELAVRVFASPKRSPHTHLLAVHLLKPRFIKILGCGGGQMLTSPSPSQTETPPCCCESPWRAYASFRQAEEERPARHQSEGGGGWECCRQEEISWRQKAAVGHILAKQSMNSLPDRPICSQDLLQRWTRNEVPEGTNKA